MNSVLPSWFNTLFHPRGLYHKENSKAPPLQENVGWRLVVDQCGSGWAGSCLDCDCAPFSLPDSTGSVNGVDMLKVHCSHPHLIVQLKFCKQENCRRFLRSYREGVLQKSLQSHLQLSLATTTVPLQVELKAGSEHLDKILKDEDHCLECIYREKVSRRGREAGQQ